MFTGLLYFGEEQDIRAVFQRTKKGERPPIHSVCPPKLKDLMPKCWHSKPEERPTFADVITILDEISNEVDKQLLESLHCGGHTEAIKKYKGSQEITEL